MAITVNQKMYACMGETKQSCNLFLVQSVFSCWLNLYCAVLITVFIGYPEAEQRQYLCVV